MNTYILAVDKSNFRKRIESVAIQFLDSAQDDIHIIHIIEDLPEEIMGQFLDPEMIKNRLKKESDKITGSMSQNLESEGFSVDITIEQGLAGPRICEKAQNLEASGVFIGQQGRSAVRNFLLGSVSDYVVHHAPCPVILVPG